jgi:hypothetical protein
VTQSTDWIWRARPGAHERHLQRRYNNLLFPALRRIVTLPDVITARRKDDSEFNELREQVKTIELPDTLPQNWGAFLNNIRERIDAAADHAREIGGDTSLIIDLLASTRSNMMLVWRTCLKADSETLRKLDEAEALHIRQQIIFHADFINQIRRKDRCIPVEEWVPAMLCEDADTVAACWAVWEESMRNQVKLWAAQVVLAAQKEGFNILSIKEQLYVLGWPRQEA